MLCGKALPGSQEGPLHGIIQRIGRVAAGTKNSGWKRDATRVRKRWDKRISSIKSADVNPIETYSSVESVSVPNAVGLVSELQVRLSRFSRRKRTRASTVE